VVEIGKKAIAGEKNSGAGKGISSLGCYGAGGGTWAMPYDEERLACGSMEADQIKATGAEIVVAPHHNCRDQIMKGLSKVHDLGNNEETLYLWEPVANCLEIKP
jgi:Fe-S oxidoreductase